jgi:hypothetical protein
MPCCAIDMHSDFTAGSERDEQHCCSAEQFGPSPIDMSGVVLPVLHWLEHCCDLQDVAGVRHDWHAAVPFVLAHVNAQLESFCAHAQMQVARSAHGPENRPDSQPEPKQVLTWLLQFDCRQVLHCGWLPKMPDVQTWLPPSLLPPPGPK